MTAPMSPEQIEQEREKFYKWAKRVGLHTESADVFSKIEAAWLARASLAPAEAERKDAERYRWLREQPHFDIAACWFLPASLKAVASVTTIEDAIDAAMKEPGRG